VESLHSLGFILPFWCFTQICGSGGASDSNAGASSNIPSTSKNDAAADAEKEARKEMSGGSTMKTTGRLAT